MRRTHGRAPFTIPGGPIVPIAALAVSLAILWGATAAQLAMGAYFLAGGAVLYLAARMGRSV
jgi:hypothetical protein